MESYLPSQRHPTSVCLLSVSGFPPAPCLRLQALAPVQSLTLASSSTRTSEMALAAPVERAAPVCAPVGISGRPAPGLSCCCPGVCLAMGTIFRSSQNFCSSRSKPGGVAPSGARPGPEACGRRALGLPASAPCSLPLDAGSPQSVLPGWTPSLPPVWPRGCWSCGSGSGGAPRSQPVVG